MIRALITVLLALGSVQAAVAQGWDGVREGRILSLEVSSGSNFAIRVHLDAAPMCANGPSWAYMNRNWDNYDAAVALITSAYLANKSVIVYSRNIGGNCEIGHLTFR